MSSAESNNTMMSGILKRALADNASAMETLAGLFDNQYEASLQGRYSDLADIARQLEAAEGDFVESQQTLVAELAAAGVSVDTTLAEALAGNTDPVVDQLLKEQRAAIEHLAISAALAFDDAQRFTQLLVNEHASTTYDGQGSVERTVTAGMSLDRAL